MAESAGTSGLSPPRLPWGKGLVGRAPRVRALLALGLPGHLDPACPALHLFLRAGFACLSKPHGAMGAHLCVSQPANRGHSQERDWPFLFCRDLIRPSDAYMLVGRGWGRKQRKGRERRGELVGGGLGRRPQDQTGCVTEQVIPRWMCWTLGCPGRRIFALEWQSRAEPQSRGPHHPRTKGTLSWEPGGPQPSHFSCFNNSCSRCCVNKIILPFQKNH